MPAATRARVHVRVTGGTASQTFAPDDWSAEQVNGWVGLQKKHGIGFVFVVNGNDTPESQHEFLQRWVTAGARLSFLEMMNEYYLGKFRDPKKVGDPDFPEVTRVVTLQDYTDSILPTYMAALSGFGLPMFVIGAPKGPESDGWNTAIRDFLVKTRAAQPQLGLGVTVHLYDRGAPFDYGQLDALRGLMPSGTPIAVTECGLLDDSVKTPEESAARHLAHDTQVLAHLVPGDYLLDQVLYSHTPLVTTLAPGGLTPKGAAVVGLFESVTP
ncbi:MAG: hypothetical protein IT374_21310 [Polyangiaceae bacterium]|nr:hypothetical protein [Polyangiaceae bacterium]